MKKIVILYILSILLPSVDYNSQIQPIFDNNCGNCHLGNSLGGLNLSNYSNLMSSNTVIPGNHEASSLYDRITRSESQAGDMPPSGALYQTEIDLIAQWIDEGALEFPANECDEDYTFIDNFPQNTCIPLDGSNCFYTQDIEALQDIIDLNNLDLINPLYLGFQNWSGGRITRLLVGNNSNGGFITLNQLPESIGDLDGLIQLYIDDNELTSLPNEIGNLSNLVYLVANFNNITALPESIGNLSNLNFLDLGYNEISYIPESIGNLSNLQYLWIFDNQLSTLPESICNLNLDWDGFTQGVSVVPYFGCGGNLLCNNSEIPDCVENSANFEIALDAAYYLFSVVHEQDCEEILLGDVNLDNFINVLDVVTLVQYIIGGSELNEDEQFAADINEDNAINVLDVVTLVNAILE